MALAFSPPGGMDTTRADRVAHPRAMQDNRGRWRIERMGSMRQNISLCMLRETRPARASRQPGKDAHGPFGRSSI